MEVEHPPRVLSQVAAGQPDLGGVRRRLHDWYRGAAVFHREPAVAEAREGLSNTLLAEQSTMKELA
ncbi:hypothetical protein NOGI109294_07455 [Nocardiopsis gilva]|uniref:hypothetical protein n=1 Tax=Nocardiopsis gilva TaxID=280236 RepID=UPI0003483F4D|nr:hypothetical protein [Nocardiopsis gilva]